MDIKNMKVSIGIVIAIVAQAFGIIWYVAQLDSTVSNLDTTVTTLQEDATTVDVAVLEKDVINIREMIDNIVEDRYDPSGLEELIDEVEGRVNMLETKDALIENEMRTIMSDHSNFNDVLKDMGKSGYGDNREYGNYDY